MLPPQQTCPSCKQVLPVEAFGKSSSRPSGYQWTCRECSNAYKREWKRAHKDAYKAAQRRWKYGLEQEDYERMLAECDGKCMACGLRVKLVIDHDHISGVVRGLLCQSCNVALGHVMDNPQRLRDLIAYLESR